VRFHQDVTLSEVMALAAWMSVKNAAFNLPYGGAKGGVRVGPQLLSRGELERVTRRYTSEIGVLIGPTKDIPAPDVNTNEQVMAWMMDTFSMNEGSTATGVVTGKPLALGGSLGRREATGRGVFTVGEAAAQRLKLPLNGARVARHGSVKGFANAEVLANDPFWSVPCDILIPAALEQQITADNAAAIQARLVIEGANGPTTPEADDILSERGVLVIPDVIANAGGVTVSYFEWVQDFSSFFWSEDEINARLVRFMQEALASIWSVADANRVSLRTAAFIVACTRILQARELRGLYP